MGAVRRLVQKLGPGWITGASKNDPASITTYVKIGAQFGFGMLWTLLFSYPLLAVVQEISARIGRATGRGVAGNLRRHYPGWVLYSVVGLVFGANVLNLGADIAAMGAAVNLLLGGPQLLWAVLLATLSLLLQVFMPYSRYVGVLKWFTVVLLAYVVAAFVFWRRWARRSTRTCSSGRRRRKPKSFATSRASR